MPGITLMRSTLIPLDKRCGLSCPAWRYHPSAGGCCDHGLILCNFPHLRLIDWLYFGSRLNGSPFYPRKDVEAMWLRCLNEHIPQMFGAPSTVWTFRSWRESLEMGWCGWEATTRARIWGWTWWRQCADLAQLGAEALKVVTGPEHPQILNAELDRVFKSYHLDPCLSVINKLRT